VPRGTQDRQDHAQRARRVPSKPRVARVRVCRVDPTRTAMKAARRVHATSATRHRALEGAGHAWQASSKTFAATKHARRAQGDHIRPRGVRPNARTVRRTRSRKPEALRLRHACAMQDTRVRMAGHARHVRPVTIKAFLEPGSAGHVWRARCWQRGARRRRACASRARRARTRPWRVRRSACCAMRASLGFRQG
jgi:hypothetical protein